MISVVVLTLNEAGNLSRCLDSVRFSDDVLVLDSGSTDATCAIAQAGGARVLMRPFDSFARQRNYAMTEADIRHHWVLHLDADEVVTPQLRDELLAIAESESAEQAVWRVPSKLIFMGRWLRRSGMYPAYQARFGRRDALRFIDHGHGQRETVPLSQVGTLRAPLEHYNFSKGINDWFARHLRYAAAEAEQAFTDVKLPLNARELLASDPTVRRRAMKRVASRLPFRPSLRFLYVYFLRGGLLDGVAGYRYARMLGIYQSFIDLHIAELRSVAKVRTGA